MRLLFCSGAGHAPQGRKSQALLDAGYEVIAPNYRELDVTTAADIITYQLLEQLHPVIVVASSFGGAAALLAMNRSPAAWDNTAGLVLCAPALFLAESILGAERLRCPAPTILIHGTSDESIAIELSRAFACQHDVRLIEVEDDHALSRSLGVMLEAVAALHEE